jgi:hypothetical protein
MTDGLVAPRAKRLTVFAVQNVLIDVVDGARSRQRGALG